MINVLIIASSIKDTAPGKVFANYINIIKQMENVKLKIISTDISEKDIHHRIKKSSVSLLGYDAFDYASSKTLVDQIYCRDIDIVFTMMSANHFIPLYAGYLIKKRYNNIKWINYCVDAIPAPDGWGLSKPYKNGLIRMLKKFLVSADEIYFSNQVMLDYQLEILGKKYCGESGVLYTLPSGSPINIPRKVNNEEFVLIYTGGIYQARKVDQLLIAVEKLIEQGLKIKLNFVGTNPESVSLKGLNMETVASINFIGYTEDLLPLYQNADLLIDIDADIEKDVFISSKFFSYLTVNRNILCITRQGSPVDILISHQNIKGVYVSSHSYRYIMEKVLYIMSNRKDINAISRSEFFLNSSNDIFNL